MKTSCLSPILCALFLLPPTMPSLHAQADLYIRDTATDTGVEPNPDPGSMWKSVDIWVRNSPDPNYDPRPFPTAAPTWTPLVHENPEYDDPKYGYPAYIYVRMHNRSAEQTSSGTERLRVYWAKASTGLGWPNQWVDYLDNTCGPTRLFGMEVTKPRKNAALASAAERTAYINALLDIDALALHQFSDGVQYWDKQNVIHDVGGALHGVPGFLPWHREFLNRLEILMRESNPVLTLMYWDWTTDPRTGFGVDLFNTGFMGSSSGAVGMPLGALQPPNLSRNVGSSSFTSDADATITGLGTYPAMWDRLEDGANPPVTGMRNHNSAHGYIGGGGNMSFLNTAAQDPFFFLLHGNVDKIWAAWQRDPAHPERLDPTTTYGTSSGQSSIVNTMSPWDGGTGVSPWTNPGEQANKTAAHHSVVAPPVYDTVPLVIPVLQPGESCVIQIPWFPPDPSEFGCFGDPGHFCLLARIETDTVSPFGMTFLEGVNVGTNTRNNNNIAWKNITVVDNVARLRFLSLAIIRNFFETRQLFRFQFLVPPEDANRSFFNVGGITLLAPDAFVEAWLENNMIGESIRIGDRTPEGQVELILEGPRAYLEVPLEPRQSFPIGIAFNLEEQVPDEDRRLPYHWDFEQILVGDPDEVVGGQTFTIDVSKFRLIDRESEWAYHDAGEDLGQGWFLPDYDDADWARGRAPLGFGDGPQTVVYGGPDTKRHTVYFRKAFQADRLEIYNRFELRLCVDDGAVVYLNGEEIYRHNMPQGDVEFTTMADQEVTGVRECVYWLVPLGDELPLKEGDNVLAVEVHQNAPDSDDLHFDLALCANRVPENLKPELKIVSPRHGDSFAPGTRIELAAEALDQDGLLRSVQFLVDGQLIATLTEEPYRVLLDELAAGAHELTAVARDDQNTECVASIRILVARGLPPVVEITRPRHHVRVAAGVPIHVEVAVPSSPSAPVNEVSLYLREGDDFARGLNLVSSREPIATDRAAPYQFMVPGLEPGIYMIQAGATDEAGNTGSSPHVHIRVVQGPTLTVERRGGNLIIAWDPAQAILQATPLLGEPWVDVENAESPLTLPLDDLNPEQRFFRAVLPMDANH